MAPTQYFVQGRGSNEELDEVHDLMNSLSEDGDYETTFRVLANTINLYGLEGKDKVLAKMKLLVDKLGRWESNVLA